MSETRYEIWEDVNITAISEDVDDMGFCDIETSQGVIRGKQLHIGLYKLFAGWHGNLVVYQSRTAPCLAYDQTLVPENIITEESNFPWVLEFYCDVKPISTNAMFYRNKKKTKEYEDFQLEVLPYLQGRACPQRIRDGDAGLALEVHFGFATNASDLDNGLKSLIDTLSSILGFNDNIIRDIKAVKHISGKGKWGIKVKLYETEKLTKDNDNNHWRLVK